MAIQIVYWQSTDNICCNRTLPIAVIICLDPALVGQQSCPGGGVTNFEWPGIGAQLVDVYTVNNDCNNCLIYHYTVQYDDTQLVPGTKLETKDIQGMFCFGCLLQVVLASAGSEVSLRQNEDGSYTLTSQHGCEYNFVTSGVSVEDTPSLDLHLVGTTLSGDVNLSTSFGNSIVEFPDGLYVAPVGGLTVSDTSSVDLTLAGSNLSADAKISLAGGNILTLNVDGLFVAAVADFIQSVSDTNSVTLTVGGNNLTADVIVSPDAGNQLTPLGNGLFVGPAPGDFIQSVSDTESIDLDVTGNNLTANAIISPNAGNTLIFAGNGLFVPTPGSAFIQSVSDTNSVDLTVTGTDLTADVKISASFGNQIFVAGDGILVNSGAGITVSDTQTIDMVLGAPADISANVIISPNAGNILTNPGNGLFVPTDFVTSVVDTATVDLDVTAGALTANVISCQINPDGWWAACESWSPDTATTITVPSDATLKYAVGDKIRLVQDAITKYFYVIEVTATLLTVTAGTDFTLSANPITDPFFSHMLSPVGHPQRFTYTPTFNGFSVDPATPEVQWSLFGKMAHLAISTGEGVSDDTVFEVSLLVPMMVTANTFSARGAGFSGTDNGTFAPNIMAAISSLAPTILQLFTNSGSATTWTASGNKAANATIDYPIT